MRSSGRVSYTDDGKLIAGSEEESYWMYLATAARARAAFCCSIVELKSAASGATFLASSLRADFAVMKRNGNYVKVF